MGKRDWFEVAVGLSSVGSFLVALVPAAKDALSKLSAHARGASERTAEEVRQGKEEGRSPDQG